MKPADFALHIEKPTLVVNKERAHNNIKKMADKARKSGVRFKPHFKTHQSAAISDWFKEFDVNSITVSSVDMAGYFAEHGWKDITIAFPVNFLQIRKINKLAHEISLNLLAESGEAVGFLRRNVDKNVRIWIKIDVGYHRTGIDCDNFKEILDVVRDIEKAPNLILSGILTHAGHSYDQRSNHGIKKIYQETVGKLNEIRDKLRLHDFKDIEISIGDTPCCSVVDEFTGVDEIRPGNFVFYDIMQLEIGSCTEQDIALAAACPVVAKHEERNEIVIYGGAVHLSKDFIIDKKERKIFGRAAFLEKNGWGSLIRNTYVKTLSQEHGIIKTDSGTFNKIQVGDVLMVLPVHSCLTADLLRNFITLEGEKIQAAQYDFIK
ncbi:hypothetical protein AMJ80_06295 [bacterium SM23_31]|nr:MAG: hypothetical protein AMJ80_06295 [bacterium SM23_31]